MAVVLMSNPGLPFAVYGNPRKSRRGKPRIVRLKVSGKKIRVNPSKSKMMASIRKKFPGYKVISIRSVKPKRKTRKANPQTRKGSSKKAHTMAKTRRRRKSRSKRRARTTRSRSRSRARGRKTYKTKRTYRGRGVVAKVFHVTKRKRRGSRRKLRGLKWTGKRGTKSYRGVVYRKGRRGARRARFTNPRALAGYVGGITSAPGAIFRQIRNFKLKDLAFTAGGSAATYLVGGILGAKVVQPILDRILPMTVSPDVRAMVSRVVGASLPYSAAFLATKFLIKDKKLATPLMLGGALASILELIKPSMVGDLLTRVGLGADKLPASLHGLGAEALAGPTVALAGYVEAPSYSGVGEDPAVLAGYVEAPSYSGVGDYLAEKNEYLAKSYLDG